MAGQMIEFATQAAPARGYLAEPAGAPGPGVLVLHAWWGLTEPFRAACDRLAEAGFLALAPDLYHGKTAMTVEEAETLGGALDEDVEGWRGDVAGALRELRQRGARVPADRRSGLGLVGFSLGGAYALDTSVTQANAVAAVAVFYDAYPGLDYASARAAYLLHYAEDDSFIPAKKIEALRQDLQEAEKRATIHIYPGTKHWFFEDNRPDAYDAAAAALAWQRTTAFLNAELRG